jgi:hypothetical protein
MGLLDLVLLSNPLQERSVLPTRSLNTQVSHKRHFIFAFSAQQDSKIPVWVGSGPLSKNGTEVQ